jgi:hypothetical protein
VARGSGSRGLCRRPAKGYLELPITPLPGTWVNMGIKKGRSCLAPALTSKAVAMRLRNSYRPGASVFFNMPTQSLALRSAGLTIFPVCRWASEPTAHKAPYAAVVRFTGCAAGRALLAAELSAPALYGTGYASKGIPAWAIPGTEASTPPTRAAPINLSALPREMLPLASPLARSSKERSLASGDMGLITAFP